MNDYHSKMILQIRTILLGLTLCGILSVCSRRGDEFYVSRWSYLTNDIFPDLEGELLQKDFDKSMDSYPLQMTSSFNSQPTDGRAEVNFNKTASSEGDEPTFSLGPKKPSGPIDDRDKRLFFKGFTNLFSKFLGVGARVRANSCVATSGDNGTCYRNTDCSRMGGNSTGTCTGGTVCCVFQRTCGGTTRQNLTYFINSGYPNSFDAVGSCQLIVEKMNENICQLRLDFDTFTLTGPDATSTICNNDRFTVTGASSMPTICGLNAGNHMYINLGPGASTPTTLSFITMGTTFQRKWKVKISQIPCNTAYTAPDNCLQYLTGITGKIRTYNFDFENGNQLADQDYTACIRTERNFCGIQYTPCPDPAAGTGGAPRSFTISGVGSPGSQRDAQTCSTDWVLIPCAVSAATSRTTNCFDRLCGSLLNLQNTGVSTAGNAAAFSFIKPFVVIYHTNNNEQTGESGNRGFCLDYVQQPCT